MSRIIDADEVLNLIYDEKVIETNSNEVAFNDALEVAIQIIDTQKTVKAIPIEFIKQLIEEFDCERGNAIKDTFAHILTGLLEFWEFEQEKENEKSGISD